MNTRPFLPMWRIGQQHQRRGSINAAYTRLCSTGLQDACLTVFRKILEILRSRPLDQSYLNDLDGLQPTSLAQATRARLTGLPELADPSLDASELRKRFTTLTGIRAKSLTRVSREGLAQTEAAVDEAATRLQASLERTFATGPDKIRTTAEQVRQALQGLAFPLPDLEPLARLGHILKAIDQIHARRNSLTASAFDFVIAQLTNLARTAYEQALCALASELACDVFRRRLQKLQGFLDEIVTRGTEFTKKMSGLQAQLEARRKQAASDQRVSRASVILPLEGPDEKQVLAGMIARSTCSDLGDLTTQLLGRFEAALRDLAPQKCPFLDANNAPVPQLVCAMDHSDLADAFVHLVEQSVGRGHTIYEVLAQHSVEACAGFLYNRAAPTCHLGGRDIEAFNVSTAALTIVRLPPPVGPRDEEIRVRLAETFEALGYCTVRQGAESDRSITVVRLELGWPLGIERANRPLLERYVRSGSRGHVPHLVGLFPDAPLGTIRPKNKALAIRSSPVFSENHHA